MARALRAHFRRPMFVEARLSTPVNCDPAKRMSRIRNPNAHGLSHSLAGTYAAKSRCDQTLPAPCLPSRSTKMDEKTAYQLTRDLLEKQGQNGRHVALVGQCSPPRADDQHQPPMSCTAGALALLRRSPGSRADSVRNNRCARGLSAPPCPTQRPASPYR